MDAQSSNKKVWWTCDTCGHEWNDTIYSRVALKKGCPRCEKENETLAVKSPALIPFWHPTKNGADTPYNTKDKAAKPVYWICEKGHEWSCSPHSQSRTSICPYCSGKKLLAEYNSLAVTHPKVAALWHPTKNEDLTPEDVMANSPKMAWWLYHYFDEKTGKQFTFEWRQQIKSRANSKKLPFENNSILFVGFNDLETVNPTLALEWNYSRNGDVTPRDITTKGNQEFWWICPTCKHEWIDDVQHRHLGYGCPHCREKEMSSYWKKRKVTVGYDDLATTHPELAAQWHPSKNKIHTPQTLTANSTSDVWWMYSYQDPETQKTFNFEWQQSVRRRVLDPTCPFLKGTRKWAGFNSSTTLEVGFIADFETKEVTTKQNNEEDFSEKFFT